MNTINIIKSILSTIWTILTFFFNYKENVKKTKMMWRRTCKWFNNNINVWRMRKKIDFYEWQIEECKLRHIMLLMEPFNEYLKNNNNAASSNVKFEELPKIVYNTLLYENPDYLVSINYKALVELGALMIIYEDVENIDNGLKHKHPKRTYVEEDDE